jgi:exonuclease SbcC
LLFTDFDGLSTVIEKAAPPEIEALLTCGLTKDAYDSMFGLDHRRLRDGGQALLKGEGDIGAALFEASAGVRSIPQVLERLDASARKFFVPGRRGKYARINEALASYEEHHSEFKRAQIRPAQWVELLKKHEGAVGEVAEIENRRIEINRELLLINELRAVAPLLSTLDSANRALQELNSVRLLSPNADIERAAAESGLSDAQHNADISAAEFARQQRKVSELKPDAVILAVGTAVKRLASAVEAIDENERDIADAAVDVAAETDRVTALASNIQASAVPDEVLARAPTKAQKAGIEVVLRRVELAQQAVHGELLIKRRPVCGKGHDSVLARRIAADQRLEVKSGRVARMVFCARAHCGRALHCSSWQTGRACAEDPDGSRTRRGPDTLGG